jgi:phosphatidylserine decarboxylase
VRIDRAAWPFVLIAATPAALAFVFGLPALGVALLLAPVAIALFFRDPERRALAGDDLVLSPADGKVIYAGLGRQNETPPGDWQQVTIFLSPLDVHINRAPASGRVTRVDYFPGTFRPAYHHDAHRNERSEVWLDHHGQTIVFRQVVGAMARRVVCRVRPGDELEPGARVGLMKFGSRMDVFVPPTAELLVSQGDRVLAALTAIARLRSE